ncbi:MAG: ABC transporter substrate-binding protein [Rhodobacterales bacterium]|nr:ABC transporter substrate-binding protein [Rhodobacterales bacterium]MDX5499746.1 ABC transporter substrate-binding protein [Rhodobacterales bacterium]
MITLMQARLPLRDPHDCTDGADELCLYEAFFDTLVRRDGTGYAPRLATSWTVSPDARTWRFTLRDGVRFHDGSPCDAAAVCASLMRMARPDKGYTLGAPGVWAQYLGDARITAPDGQTVQIALSHPMADLPDVLVQGYIVAPSSVADLEAGVMTRPVGTGPYRLTAMGEGWIEAEAVAHFAGTPANARIRWQAEPDPARRLAALQDGRAHLAAALDYRASQGLGPDCTRLETLSPVAIIYLLNAARGPLADARVRLALALAMDRDALIGAAVHGGARPLHGFVSPLHFGAGTAPAPARDLSAARALLAGAGYPDGLTLGLDCPTRLPDEAERLTAALAGQLAEIGVTLDVHIHPEREDYAHMVRRKEIRDLCVFDSSPLSTFRVLYEKIDARIAGSWWEGYHNPKVEALIDQGRATTDDAARAAIYARAYALMQADPPWLTLYNPIKITGLRGRHPGFALPVDAVIRVADLPALGGL